MHQTTMCLTPEDSHLHTRRRENLKSDLNFLVIVILTCSLSFPNTLAFQLFRKKYRLCLHYFPKHFTNKIFCFFFLPSKRHVTITAVTVNDNFLLYILSSFPPCFIFVTCTHYQQQQQHLFPDTSKMCLFL
jgi:hypothetical protein